MVIGTKTVDKIILDDFDIYEIFNNFFVSIDLNLKISPKENILINASEINDPAEILNQHIQMLLMGKYDLVLLKNSKGRLFFKTTS